MFGSNSMHAQALELLQMQTRYARRLGFCQLCMAFEESFDHLSKLAGQDMRTGRTLGNKGCRKLNSCAPPGVLQCNYVQARRGHTGNANRE
eukprot:scaffold199595_cov20-Tisochrysis_lutea.AAC.1